MNDKITNLEFLKDIYKNANQNINSINDLFTKVNDLNLKRELENQLHDLRSVEGEVSRILKDNEVELKDLDTNKIGKWTSLQINTLTNKETPHLAKLITDQNNECIIDLTKSLNEHQLADANIKNYASRLLEIEKGGNESMKTYL